MRIENITIVGGGTSGWMAAAMLQCQHKGKINVTLVESKSTPSVGVGESTIIIFNSFLSACGMKDEDWMSKCNATYKNNIRFVDFKEKGSVLDYPFGGDRGSERVAYWSQLSAAYNLPDESYAEFCGSHNYFLSKYNKQTKNTHGVLDFNFNNETAYHFDAGLFADYLKNEICTDVRHYYDDITSVDKDENGYLKSVNGKIHGPYKSDLFIDCTGFQSRLLEEEMGSEFLSFKPWLSNDKALATHLPYKNKEEELTNSTTCTAIDNGWVYNIPLWNNYGTGYVYSSDFVDDDRAYEEFKKHLGVDELEIENKIDIRHGVRKNAWVKNVVGIGLSYAFVEPLESTSLVSTITCLDRLSELMVQYDYKTTPFIIDGYNYACQVEMCNYRDFIGLHYKLSHRNDTPYWRYQTEGREWFNMDESKFYEFHRPDSVGLNAYNSLQFHINMGHNWLVLPGQGDGLYHIMAGMGYRPFGKQFYDNYVVAQAENREEAEKNLEKLYDQFKEDKKSAEKYVLTQKSSCEFLQEHIYGFDN